MMNNLARLTKSEQILIAITLTLILLGGYAILRFIPKYQDISTIARSAEKTEQKLLKARMPEEPLQGVTQLNNKISDQEKAVALISDMVVSVQQRLAPIDSQELKVLISKLARDLQVRITANEQIDAKPAQLPMIALSNKKKNNKKKSTVAETSENIILPPNYSWLERMAPKTLFYRPLQRVELLGHYLSIRTFIQELDNLPWQVTVVRMKIDKQPLTPIRGYAQPLKAELVLAL